MALFRSVFAAPSELHLDEVVPSPAGSLLPLAASRTAVALNRGAFSADAGLGG